MTGVTFRDFPIDPAFVAPCIYKDLPHRTTTHGAVLSSGVREGLRALLGLWLELAGVTNEIGTYCRLDAYPDAMGNLHVLEGNWNFVDGWGTALNLSRVAGRPVTIAPTWKGTHPLFSGEVPRFPVLWATEDEAYLPELKLALNEFVYAGLGGDTRIVPSEVLLGAADELSQPGYLYGRHAGRSRNTVLCPLYGPELDDKTHLINLSLTWEGEHLHVPMTYGCEVEEWDNLPRNVVFKPRCKWASDLPVRFRDEVGKGRSARRRYTEQETVAQEVVGRHLVDGRPTQLVIMCAGTEPVTGYVQYAEPRTRVINDNSIHAPLIFADD